MASHPLNAKAREAALRRRAKKLDLRISRSRRNLSLDNFGRFAVLSTASNVFIAGSRYELSLEAVDAFLRAHERRD